MGNTYPPFQQSYSGQGHEVFSETEEMELAGQMLEITNDAELDQFLGDLIRRAGHAAGRFIMSDTGRALGSLLKGAARKVLPALGSSVGSYFGGPAGARIGGQLATAAGRTFGLELEGLSPEDQEFEVARRFVRFAGTSARRATLAPETVSAGAAAKNAVAGAAKQYAPGLFAGTTASAGIGDETVRPGRWIRRGRNIIIVNC